MVFTGFGANSLNFGIRAHANFSDWVSTRTELSLRVHEALVAAGIEIPFPQQDVHIRSIDKAARAELGPREPASAAAAVPKPPVSGS